MSIKIDNDELIEFKLFDIFSTKVQQHSFRQNINLDVSMLPQGSYFYQLSSKKAVLKVGKLVKMD